jgi:signal transduction histidine kinase
MRPIDAAFARQRAFVADASHELRTPLTLIRANAELVQRLDAPEPEAVQAEMSRILDGVDEMSHLVDDLLLLARIDDAAVALERRVVDLPAMTASVVESLADRAQSAGLTVAFEADRPVSVAVDEARIRQVIRILLDNAIAYTPAGGTITVFVEQHGGKAALRVRDTGIGIPAADLPHVFERFFRADRARSRATGGVGLGLAIARVLVEAHGGEIHLDSAAGAGTTAWFALPVAAG